MARHLYGCCILPKFNTKTYGYKSLVYAGAKLWNSLPVTFKKCTCIHVFKEMLSKWQCHNMLCDRCHNFMYHDSLFYFILLSL